MQMLSEEKKLKKKIFVLLAIMMVIGDGVLAYAKTSNDVMETVENESSESETEPQFVAPDIEEENIAIGIGQSKQITIPKLLYSSVVNPETGEVVEEYIDACAVYTVTDAAIAQVSPEGIVTGIMQGQTTITVEYSYTKDDVVLCTGTAEINIFVTDMTLSAEKFLLNIYGVTKSNDNSYKTGDYVTLVGYNEYSSIEIIPSSKNLLVKKSGEDYYFCPKKAGDYTVTFIADGKSLTCEVSVLNLRYVYNGKSVTDVKAKNWESGSTLVALGVGETTTLKVKGFPENTNVKWTSSNKKVATVTKDGTVKAKSLGYTTISASAKGYTITYEIGVADKTSIKAMRYAVKHFNSTYSQPKRMSKGYYDCSSYVWRAYKDAGFNIGNCKTGWAPVAASLAQWCVNNKYMVYSGTVDVDNLLPGDLIFWTGAKNGRYKGIYHVDMYVGNHHSLTVAREKAFGDVITNCMVARPNAGTKIGKVMISRTKSSGKVVVKLSWSSCYYVTGYNIYRKTGSNGKYKKLATVKDGRSYIDTSVKSGNTYYYKIRPYWKANSKAYAGKYSKIVNRKI